MMHVCEWQLPISPEITLPPAGLGATAGCYESSKTLRDMQTEKSRTLRWKEIGKYVERRSER